MSEVELFQQGKMNLTHPWGSSGACRLAEIFMGKLLTVTYAHRLEAAKKVAPIVASCFHPFVTITTERHASDSFAPGTLEWTIDTGRGTPMKVSIFELETSRLLPRTINTGEGAD